MLKAEAGPKFQQAFFSKVWIVLNSTLASMEQEISKYPTGILENTLTIKE